MDGVYTRRQTQAVQDNLVTVGSSLANSSLSAVVCDFEAEFTEEMTIDIGMADLDS